MQLKDDVQEILDNLVSAINSDRILTFVRNRLFCDAGGDYPMGKWSFLNQLIAVTLGRTNDARGFRQWQTVNRAVKKGSHAFHILGPSTIKTEKPKADNPSEKEEVSIVVGYHKIPVFAIEDTDGEALPYNVELEAFDVSTLPLLDVAESIGVSVNKAVLGFGGYFQPSENKIVLGGESPLVFFHELAHAIDNHLPGKVDDRGYKECVAEMSAAALGQLFGLEVDIDNSVAYIKGWKGTSHKAQNMAKIVERVVEICAFV